MESNMAQTMALLRSASECVQARLQQVPKPMTMIHACVTATVLLVTMVFFAAVRTHVATRPRRYLVPVPQLPDTTTCSLSTEEPAALHSSHIACYAPATGQFLGNVRAATTADIDAAIAAAATAQKEWAATTTTAPTGVRHAVLRSLLQYVLDHAETICRVAALDSGKTLVDAQLGEVLVTAERLRWTLRHGAAALAPETRPRGSLLMAHKRNSLRYEPMGVVAALVSWNYPFHNLLGPVVSSLFAGNAIVVKVSEQTAWSAAVYFAAIVRGALRAHAADPNLVHVLACWPREAAYLAAHPGLAHITFIGSRPVAHHVAAAAARALTPVVAELGGKDACIVLDSALPDLARVIEVILRGTFQAAGQNCVGIERVIAARGPVYDALVERLAPRVRALRLGPGYGSGSDDAAADVGALISAASFDRLEALVRDAVDRGARLLAGGSRYTHPDFPSATYFQPTMLVDVTPDMAIARHECFAPILTLMCAEASTSKAMLAIANADNTTNTNTNTNTNPDTTTNTTTDFANPPPPRFGLGASVFGAEHTDPAVEEIVHGLDVGMVAVNDFAAYYAVQLPFGGVRGSGYGRFAGAEGLRGLCNLKSVCEDRRCFAWCLGLAVGVPVRTAIPPPLRYPVPSQEAGWRFAQAAVELGYGTSLASRVMGLWGMWKNM